MPDSGAIADIAALRKSAISRQPYRTLVRLILPEESNDQPPNISISQVKLKLAHLSVQSGRPFELIH